MKQVIVVAVFGLALLSGCATSQPDKGSSSASAASSTPAVRPPVSIPAASAKKMVLVMTGTKNVLDASDWAGFKEEWRATFADHAKEAGIAFSAQDSMPKPGGDAGTVLAVHVNDYRMVGIGARVFLGVLTGNAFIDAKVGYADLKSGKPFGEQTFNTTSSAWHGVFGKMTPQQVDAIASDVFQELKAAR